MGNDIENAARAGDIDAINELATTYMNQMDYVNARKWAKLGTAQNDPWSMHIMGYMAQEEEKYIEAVKWYERNININSHSLSASNLGMLYLNGDENPAIPTNRDMAAHLFQLAINADNTNGYGYFGLGLCYLAGFGVEEDTNQARVYLQHACRLGPDGLANEARTIMNQMQNDQNTNNGGCFITTAVCDSFGKSDDCYELSMFRNFRDTWLAAQDDGESLIDEYYRIAPRIVECINQAVSPQEIYRNIWVEYLSPCLQDIESRAMQSCKERYVQMVKDLRERYLS